MDRFGEAARWSVRSNAAPAAEVTGDAAAATEDAAEAAEATVKIRKSEQFFGWLAGLGGTVRISKPERLKQEYIQYLLDRTKD